MAALNTAIVGVLMIAARGPQVAAVMALSLGQNGTRVVKEHAVCDGSQLSANVVLPGDAGYDAAREQWASKTSSSTVADARTKPQMIIFCSSDSHVQEAVSFAEACGYKISVRSGGHNYAGYSSCPEGSTDCIQVDLSLLETFALDTTTTPKRVTIGAGLTLQQVYTQLMPHGVTIQGGICHTVGVGGHFQSSAMGFFQRAFGSGMDSVKSFRIVLADAEVHTVDESSDPDLYWAVLGGGPGSWGIVLDYTVDTWENADYPNVKLYGFAYPFSTSTWVAVGNVYSAALASLPSQRDLQLSVLLDSTAVRPEYGFLPFKDFILVRGIWIGRDSGALTQGSATYASIVDAFANVPSAITLALPTPIPLAAVPVTQSSAWDMNYRNHIHGFGINEWPATDFWQTTADELASRLTISELEMSFQVFSWAGPGTQVYNNKGKNAYVLRDAKVWVDDWVFFLTDSAAQIAEDHIKAFRENTGHVWEEDGVPHSWMTPDTLVNNTHDGHVDFVNDRLKTGLKTRLARSDSDYERLQDVKTRVDPTDVFHTAMTIPPRASAGSAVGDPHLQNIYGQHFDLMQPGWHTLVKIPKQANAQRVLLLVEAEAYHDGSSCADMYFQSLNVTGEWAQEIQKGGLRFSARDSDAATGAAWMTFGKVDLKITHGHTLGGTHYLNVYVRRLGQAGVPIGGLLGEDDHTVAATPDNSCQRKLSLLATQSERSSSAEASLM